MKKSSNLKMIAALIAFASALALTGCTEEDNISISTNNETSAAETTEAVMEETEATKATTKAAEETTKAETSETKENKVTDSSKDNSDEEYEASLLKLFADNADLYSLAFSMANDFSIECDYDSNDVMWADWDTKEVILTGGKEILSDENIDFSAYPHAFTAYPLNDDRFSNLDEYNAYLKTIFSDNFLSTTKCGRERFVENNGKTYIFKINKGLLFEEWYSDEAEIKEYEKDKSFTVFVPGLKSEDPENVLYGTIKFVKEDGEWKIDSFDYNNIDNTRFKE